MVTHFGENLYIFHVYCVNFMCKLCIVWDYLVLKKLNLMCFLALSDTRERL